MLSANQRYHCKFADVQRTDSEIVMKKGRPSLMVH